MIWSKFTTQNTLHEDQASSPDLEEILHMKLSELEQNNTALQIRSEVLGSTFWICSDHEMRIQIKEFDPGFVIYTCDEISELMKLNPNPRELRRIHLVKEIFRDSKIIECNLNFQGGCK